MTECPPLWDLDGAFQDDLESSCAPMLQASPATSVWAAQTHSSRRTCCAASPPWTRASLPLCAPSRQGCPATLATPWRPASPAACRHGYIAFHYGGELPCSP